MATTTQVRDGYVLESFDGLRDVLTRLAEPPKPGANDHSRTGSHRQEWDFGLGYDGSERLYRDGWSEGANDAERLAQTLSLRAPTGRRMRFTPDVAGAFPDVPAFLAGDPQSMYSPVWRETSHPRYATLYLPIAYNGNVPAQAAFNRGVAYAALIDGLEEAGVRVRVVGYFTATLGSGTIGTMTIPVKDHSDPLNLEDLMFTVAHPAMLRRLGFALVERSENADWVRVSQSGYGRARDLTLAELPDVDEGSVTFKCLRDNLARTPEHYLRDLVSELPADMRDLVSEKDDGR